jgi:hypothetical protein
MHLRACGHRHHAALALRRLALRGQLHAIMWRATRVPRGARHAAWLPRCAEWLLLPTLGSTIIIVIIIVVIIVSITVMIRCRVAAAAQHVPDLPCPCVCRSPGPSPSAAQRPERRGAAGRGRERLQCAAGAAVDARRAHRCTAAAPGACRNASEQRGRCRCGPKGASRATGSFSDPLAA